MDEHEVGVIKLTDLREFNQQIEPPAIEHFLDQALALVSMSMKAEQLGANHILDIYLQLEANDSEEGLYYLDTKPGSRDTRTDWDRQNISLADIFYLSEQVKEYILDASESTYPTKASAVALLPSRNLIYEGYTTSSNEVNEFELAEYQHELVEQLAVLKTAIALLMGKITSDQSELLTQKTMGATGSSGSDLVATYLGLALTPAEQAPADPNEKPEEKISREALKKQQRDLLNQKKYEAAWIRGQLLNALFVTQNLPVNGTTERVMADFVWNSISDLTAEDVLKLFANPAARFEYTQALIKRLRTTPSELDRLTGTLRSPIHQETLRLAVLNGGALPKGSDYLKTAQEINQKIGSETKSTKLKLQATNLENLVLAIITQAEIQKINPADFLRDLTPPELESLLGITLPRNATPEQLRAIIEELKHSLNNLIKTKVAQFQADNLIANPNEILRKRLAPDKRPNFSNVVSTRDMYRNAGQSGAASAEEVFYGLHISLQQDSKYDKVILTAKQKLIADLYLQSLLNDELSEAIALEIASDPTLSIIGIMSNPGKLSTRLKQSPEKTRSQLNPSLVNLGNVFAGAENKSRLAQLLGMIPLPEAKLAGLALSVAQDKNTREKIFKYVGAGALVLGGLLGALFRLMGGAMSGAMVGAGVGLALGGFPGMIIGGLVGGGVGYSIAKGSLLNDLGAGTRSTPTPPSDLSSSRGAAAAEETSSLYSRFTGAANILKNPATLVIGSTITYGMYQTVFLPSSFLPPFGTVGSQGEISPYIEVNKQVAPGKIFAAPTDLEYKINLVAKEDEQGNPYTIEVISVTDQMQVALKEGDSPGLPASESYTAFQDKIKAIVLGTIPQFGPDAPVDLGAYAMPFASSGGNYADASVTNVVTVTFNVYQNGQLLLANQVASNSVAVCFGDCPQSSAGCFVWGESGRSFPYSCTEGTCYVTSQTWASADQQLIESAFQAHVGTSPSYVDKLCQDGPVTLYRLTDSGQGWGAWTMSGNTVAFYNRGLGNIINTEYTLVHETGHLLLIRNSGLSSDYLNGVSYKGLYTYPFCFDSAGNQTCNSKTAEAFSEALSLYAISTFREFPRLDGRYDFKGCHPESHEWYKNNIFGGIEFNDPDSSIPIYSGCF